MSKWFICQNEHVTGPYSTEQVQGKLQGAEVAVTDLIWGRGMAAWQNLRWWMQELPGLNVNTYAEPVPESWHFAFGGKSHGPYNRATLLNELKQIQQLGEVMLWTKGMKEWAHLFEFHDILSDLGVNKRQFPRADLQGKAVIKTDGQTLIAPTLTISEGGFSVNLEGGGLVPGQNITVEIQSGSLREPLHCRADVRYASDGIVGVKFTNINSEAKSTIIALVRQTTTRFVLKAA